MWNGKGYEQTVTHRYYQEQTFGAHTTWLEVNMKTYHWLDIISNSRPIDNNNCEEGVWSKGANAIKSWVSDKMLI